jgi:aminopeptidase N
LGNGGYDVRYVISLDVDPETGLINGKTTIEAVANARLSSFNLDFQGLEIDSVAVNGMLASYTRSENELIITPGKALRSETDFVAEIAYHGEPHATTSAASPWMHGWFHGTSGAVNVFAEPDGASTWFPANDHPLDKALYLFEITVPQPWVVAATGTLLETTEEGDDTRYMWEMDRPMASYLASVNVDHYKADVHPSPAGVTIRNFIPEGIDASLTENLELLPEMLSYFTDLFGPYPFQNLRACCRD